jgi:hypothetical protein
LLGSDEEGYNNSLMTTKNLELSTESNPKPLLEKVVLTGLSSLDGEINATYCPKLKEFRALKTNINNVTL